MGDEFHVIPTVTIGTGVVPQSQLAESAPAVAPQQVNVAAAGMPIALPYGRVRVAGAIMQPVPYGADLLVPCFIGQGPIDSVEAVEIDNKPLVAVSVFFPIYTVYLGTTTQVADPWLVAAWAALGKTYADTLPGIAYVVLRIPNRAEYSFDNIAFIVKGLKVHDPRLVPKLKAPLLTTVVPTVGPNPTSFARALAAYVKDHEGLLKLAKSGEVRFEGARRVENLVLKSQDITPLFAVWEYNNCTTVDASTITVTATPGFHIRGYLRSDGSGYAFPRGVLVAVSFEAKRISGTGNVDVDVSDIFSGTHALTTDWKRFGTPSSGAVTTAYGVDFIDFDFSATGTYGIRNVQVEVIAGQRNTNPSEYVSRGALASPYHGALVDGVKYFDIVNPNTVASNVIVDSTGLTNYFVNSAAAATQTTQSLAPGTYTIWCEGSNGSITVSAGTATITGAGTATPGAPVTFTVVTAGTVVLTVTWDNLLMEDNVSRILLEDGSGFIDLE